MKFWQKLNEMLVNIGILQETPFFYDRVSNWKTHSQKKQGHMVRLLINNITMKFHEIFPKTEREISQNLNFTRNPLFPWQQQIETREKYTSTTS